MGVGTVDAISISAIDILRTADMIFFETYTGLIQDNSIEKLSQQVGRAIKRVDRQMVEDGDEILKASVENNITALIVVGDPMAATTHVDLRLRAVDRNIPTRLIHGSSIFTSAPGLCGLSHYKFGRTTTLAYPQGDYFPTSPYEMIAENVQAGLHSLILLELTTDEDRIMSATDGIRLLLELESRVNKDVINEHTLICVIARAGTPDAKAVAGRISEFQKVDFGEPMHCLIIPGKLHFKESEALVKLCGAPEDLMESAD
jgi:diphthine synthase